MIINEMFYSLQGEGVLAGIPSIFIRLPGCPLRCRWCDTKYAWQENEGTDYSVDDILKFAEPFPTRHIVITGGEPMTHPDIRKLTDAFASQDTHLTIETAGIRYLSHLNCDLMSISPKLRNSNPNDMTLSPEYDAVRFDPNQIQQLIEEYNYQLKFVVDTEKDLADIARCLNRLENADPNRVYLMPQAATREEYLRKSPLIADFCKKTGFAFAPRLHLMLWDSNRGT